MNIKCPNCSVELPSADLKDGWCDNCGKEIPMFAYHGAGLKGPEQHVLSRANLAAAPVIAAQTDEGPVGWQLALIGLSVLTIAAIIVFTLV